VLRKFKELKLNYLLSYNPWVTESLIHNFEETILTPRTIGFLVKIVKQENDVTHTLLQCSNAFTFFIFIELFGFSLGDNFTTFFSLMKSPKKFPQLAVQL
jgi:hypothetical protein